MKRKQMLAVLLLSGVVALAQPPRGGRGAGPMPDGGVEVDSWELSVNQLNPESKQELNQIVEALQARGGATRGVVKDVLMSSLTGGVTAAVDVVATQIIELAKYKKKQKQLWMQMIQNECNYTDSMTAIKGLKDFYSEASTVGALDPSNLNFDGISLRGMRDGQEVLFLSCHIDMDRLDHMLRHSKFNLVLDTLVFHPYACHLPNLQANGIRLVRGQASERDNSFSFDERQNLSVGVEMTLTSSWINEAVMVMDHVELGTFKFNVPIRSREPVYTYSRRQIEANRLSGNSPDTTFIAIEGDCFVVPRSYMPISGGKRMWGTGEYNIKVKMRESCQFNNDKERNQKLKQWYKDYKQLRKLQKKGSQTGEYLRTVWSQNGTNLVKSMLKQGITTTIQYAGIGSQAGGMQGKQGGMQGAQAPAGGAPTGGAPAGGAPK